MQLRSFKAQGFKNFRKPVVLEDLGPINVIHGPNNVGKSNLLQAIELFFTVVGLENPSAPILALPMQTILPLSDEYFARRGFYRPDLFNLETPGPILLEATWSLRPTSSIKQASSRMSFPSSG